MSEGSRTRPTAGTGRGRGNRSASGRGPGFPAQLQETQAVLPSPRAAAEDQYADIEEDGSRKYKLLVLLAHSFILEYRFHLRR